MKKKERERERERFVGVNFYYQNDKSKYKVSFVIKMLNNIFNAFFVHLISDKNV